MTGGVRASTLGGMTGLDVNPSIVHAGMWPLFITLALIVFVVFLYRSMRKQVSRINPDLPRAPRKDPFADDEDEGDGVEPMTRDTPPDLHRRQTEPPARAGDKPRR